MTYEKLSRMWAVVIILVMAFFLLISRNLKFAAAYPRIMAITTILLGIVTIVLSFRSERESEKTEEKGDTITKFDKESIITIGILLVVPLVSLMLWDVLGFICSAFLCLSGLFIYKKQPIIKSIIVAAALVVTIQYVFGTLFQVPLPMPSWWPI